MKLSKFGFSSYLYYSQEPFVQGGNTQTPCSQLFTGSTMELLLLCVTNERRADGFKHEASGDATRFKRVLLHPSEIL
jgi:hypothetical protein